MARILALSAMVAAATAFLQPPQRIARTAMRAESLNRGSKPPMSDADKEAAMKRMGYVFDASRNTWTRPPPNRPARKPAIARSPASARLLEVRLGDGASDADVAAARGAADKFKGALKAAGAVEAAAPTPRQTLEALGMSLAAAKVVGPLVLALAQLGLWASCRDAAADFVVGDFFAGDVLPASLGDWRLAGLAAAFAVFGADPTASARPWNARALSGALEGVAADAASGGALRLPAPDAWRASEPSWRAAAAGLDLLAACPRVAALHGAMQAQLWAELAATQPFRDARGDAWVAVGACAAVAAFSAAADAVAAGSGDAVLDAERAAVAASLDDHDGDPVYGALCAAWLAEFPSGGGGGNRLAPAAAGGRAAAAAGAYALTGALAAPLALHALAAAVAVAAPLAPDADDAPDPDRCVVTIE